MVIRGSSDHSITYDYLYKPKSTLLFLVPLFSNLPNNLTDPNDLITVITSIPSIPVITTTTSMPLTLPPVQRITDTPPRTLKATHAKVASELNDDGANNPNIPNNYRGTIF